MEAIPAVHEFTFVVLLRVVSRRRREHRPAGHGIGRRLGDDTVLKERLEKISQVVDYDIGALPIEGVVGQPQNCLRHPQGRLGTGKGQFGVGGQVVDYLQQRRALVALAVLVRVDLNSGGQVAPGPGGCPSVHPVRNNAHLNSLAGQPAESPHQVGPVDRVAFSEGRTLLGVAVVGRGNSLHRFQAGHRAQVIRVNPCLDQTVLGAFDLHPFHRVPHLLQGRLVGGLQVDVNLHVAAVIKANQFIHGPGGLEVVLGNPAEQLLASRCSAGTHDAGISPPAPSRVPGYGIPGNRPLLCPTSASFVD